MHWNFNRSPKWVTVSIFRDYDVTLPCWKRDKICMYLYSIPGVKFRCVCVCGSRMISYFSILFWSHHWNSRRGVKCQRTLNYNKRKKKRPARYHLNNMQSSGKKTVCVKLFKHPCWFLLPNCFSTFLSLLTFSVCIYFIKKYTHVLTVSSHFFLHSHTVFSCVSIKTHDLSFLDYEWK